MSICSGNRAGYFSSRKLARPALVCAALLSAVPLAMAQINTANLSGLVTDPSGAAVPNVTVTVLNGANGYTRSLKTDGAGFYSFQDLPTGQYGVTVTGSGFSAQKETVTLNLGEKDRRDFHLALGSDEQTVEVQANAPALQHDDASIGLVVGEQTIERTPLYLRNWDDLLRTVPGVQISRYTQQSGNTAAGRTGDFNVNGVHSLQNDFILDGIDNNTFSENAQELSTESSHPSVDTIAEFNVITNPYSAEYGRSPGAVVSVNTKSGTNQFHGLAYEYLRNNYFDANDFFSDRNKLKKPEDNQNQFGGNFGGPVLKNKVFFFFNYEGTRIKQGVSRITTVPLPNERIGDFSPQTAAAVGVKYPTIVDPLTCAPAYSGKGCTPFANNQIPGNRIDPSVAKLIALFPLPNITVGGVTPDLNNYTRNGLAIDNDDSYDARVDWTAGPNDTVFARYNYSNRIRQIPGNFGGLADGTSTSAFGNQILKGHSAVLGWTHVLGSTMVNEFRFGWVRNFSSAQQQPFGLTQTAGDFVPGIPAGGGGGVPLTVFTNFAFLGSPDFLPKQQAPMQYQYNDTLSMTRGTQTLKFGVSVYAPMRNLFQDEPGTRGDLTFTGVFTGNSYADGLLGATQSTQLTNHFAVDQRLWMISGFVEDDWKATPRLTVNAGLRYDFATPPYEGKNQMANFDPDGAGSLVFAKNGSLSSRSLVDTNTKNFGPRIGLSYAVDDKTVVRGGYGLYYDLFERFGSEDELSLNAPFLVNKTLASNKAPVLKPSVGFPSNFLDPATINLGQLQNFHVRSFQKHDPTPNVQQWSLGMQRQISRNLLAEVDYVGTKSTHLDVIRDYNQPLINGNTSTGVVPYANFGQIEFTAPIGFGNYNGLQASLTRHFAQGFSLQASYTYSKSMDNTPEELESNSGDPPNGRNYGAWYGLSDFDVPQRVSVNATYELPFGKGKSMLNHGIAAYVLGNFRTSGVYTFYSGHPFTVNAGGTLGAALDPYGYATATPYVSGKPHQVGDPNCWFYVAGNKQCGVLSPNTANVYSLPTTGTFGNSGRNTLRGPHTDVVDASLLKEFPITERVNLEGRWEVFNVTNTPEFGQPNNNVSSTAAGQITTLSGDPRVMQFALRLSF